MPKKSSSDVLPKCDWTEKGVSLWEFVKCIDAPVLPQVVKLVRGQNDLDLGPLFNWEQPFMIYSHRVRTKIYAENVHWDSTKKDYIRDGPLMEIPKDYPGWFRIVNGKTPPNSTHTDHYDTVADIVDASRSQILLVREIASGFMIDSSGELIESIISPGEILKAEGVWSKEWKTQGGDAHGVTSTRLLKCLNLAHAEVHIPLAHPGKPFSLVGGVHDKGNPNLVYQISNVCDYWKASTVIELLFGWPPRTPNKFSGHLRLQSTSRPDCAVVYNFQPGGRLVFAELPLDVNVQVHVARNAGDFIKCDAYQTVLDVCQRMVYPYVVNVKAAMVPYEALRIERATNSDGDEGVKIKQPKNEPRKPRTFLYMSAPRDMSDFDERKVYPPIEMQFVSNTWKIVYRDPEHIYDDAATVNIEKQGETNMDSMASGLDRVSVNGMDTTRSAHKADMVGHAFVNLTVGKTSAAGETPTGESVHENAGGGSRSSRSSRGSRCSDRSGDVRVARSGKRLSVRGIFMHDDNDSTIASRHSNASIQSSSTTSLDGGTVVKMNGTGPMEGHTTSENGNDHPMQNGGGPLLHNNNITHDPRISLIQEMQQREAQC